MATDRDDVQRSASITAGRSITAGGSIAASVGDGSAVLERLAGKADSAEQAGRKALDKADEVSRQEADDRSWIARTIIGVSSARLRVAE